MGRGHLDVRGSLRDSTARWRFARRPFRARTDAPGPGGRRRLGACIERLGCWRGHWLNVVSGVVSHGRPSPFSSSPRPCAAQSGPEPVRRSIDSSELKRDGTKACADTLFWSACRLGEFWLQSHSRRARTSPMARKVGSPPGHHLGLGMRGAHLLAVHAKRNAPSICNSPAVGANRCRGEVLCRIIVCALRQGDPADGAVSQSTPSTRGIQPPIAEIWIV